MQVQINPRTGKGWTDDEELVISQVMAVEGCNRITAIQRARLRSVIGETDGTGFYQWQFEPGSMSLPPMPVPKVKDTLSDSPKNRLGVDSSLDCVVDRPSACTNTASSPATINGQMGLSWLERDPEQTSVLAPATPVPITHKKVGRRRKWQSGSQRKAAAREEQRARLHLQKPVLPTLPEGVYRARDVLSPKSATREQTARRRYHASLQDNRCFFCERLFGTYVQKISAKPEQLRIEDEHFIPRRLPGARRDDNRHAVCHICNRLKSDLVFSSEEQCRSWLAEAWQLNGYQEIGVHAIHYLGENQSVLFEERVHENQMPSANA